MLAGRDLAAAAYLLHGAENVEKLADALRFGRAGNGIRARERHAYEARARREVARQPERAHTAAVGAQIERGRERIFRLPRGERSIVVQPEELLRERRVVRQDPGGVIIDVQTVRGGLDRDAFVLVRKQPVELRGGKGGGKRRAGEIRLPEQHARRGNGGALREHPREEFKLRDVALAAARRGVCGVADKVQPRHAETFFVHRIVVERIAVGYMRHAEQGKVLRKRLAAAKGEREAPGRHDDLVAVGKLVVKRPPKIESVGFIRRGCAHDVIPRFLSYCLPLRKGALDKRRRSSPSIL